MFPICKIFIKILPPELDHYALNKTISAFVCVISASPETDEFVFTVPKDILILTANSAVKRKRDLVAE